MTYSRTLFTGIRFFDPELKEIQELIISINGKVKELSDNQLTDAIKENGLTLNLALMYDSVMLYTSAIKAMSLEYGGNVTCDSDETWNLGSTVINYVRTVSYSNNHIWSRKVISPISLIEKPACA